MKRIYRDEVAQLAEWCGANNLSLNVGKTKEVVMDFRRNSVDNPPLTIDSSTVERVSSTKFLGVHITENLTWTTNTMSLSKKAQQHLHFLPQVKRASLPPPILTTFYRGTIESMLTSCITVWYGNCSVADCKTLQHTVNKAEKIIGAPLPSILDIFLIQYSSKANSIVKEPTHPSHSLFQLLPSGRRFRSIWEPWTQITLPLSETPYKPPTSWNMDHLKYPPPPHPNLTTSQEKTVKNCNSKCATHRWVGLYKPPVVTHSPLFALDTFFVFFFTVVFFLCIGNHFYI